MTAHEQYTGVPTTPTMSSPLLVTTSSTNTATTTEPPKVNIISADGSEDVLKDVSLVTEEGDDDVEEEELSDKAKSDRQERRKYEYAIIRYTRELFAIEERLYHVRYDKSRSPEEVKRDLLNLCREYARLSAVLELLHIKSETAFETSINLHALGIPSSLQDDEYRPLADNVALAASISNIRVETDIDLLADLDTLKFMRTKSTQRLKDQSPGQKWSSMMKMFREWKTQKAAASAQKYLSAAEDRQHGAPTAAVSSASSSSSSSLLVGSGTHARSAVADEVATLRTAIKNLRLKKELSRADQLLLKKMTARLKELTSPT